LFIVSCLISNICANDCGAFAQWTRAWSAKQSDEVAHSGVVKIRNSKYYSATSTNKVDILGNGEGKKLLAKIGNQIMNTNRLAWMSAEQQTGAEATNRTGAFAFCPMGVAAQPWQQLLYQAAYEKACAVVAPWPPRWLSESWN
jgi:hypothetical protein